MRFPNVFKPTQVARIYKMLATSIGKFQTLAKRMSGRLHRIKSCRYFQLTRRLTRMICVCRCWCRTCLKIQDRILWKSEKILPTYNAIKWPNIWFESICWTSSLLIALRFPPISFKLRGIWTLTTTISFLHKHNYVSTIFGKETIGDGQPSTFKWIKTKNFWWAIEDGTGELEYLFIVVNINL